MLTKKNIIALSQQRQMELSFKNKTEGFAHATFKDLAKAFEVVIEQLEHAHGVADILLAYVPHKNIILLDEDDVLHQTIHHWMPRHCSCTNPQGSCCLSKPVYNSHHTA